MCLELLGTRADCVECPQLYSSQVHIAHPLSASLKPKCGALSNLDMNAMEHGVEARGLTCGSWFCHVGPGSTAGFLGLLAGNFPHLSYLTTHPHCHLFVNLSYLSRMILCSETLVSLYFFVRISHVEKRCCGLLCFPSALHSDVISHG